MRWYPCERSRRQQSASMTQLTSNIETSILAHTDPIIEARATTKKGGLIQWQGLQMR